MADHRADFVAVLVHLAVIIELLFSADMVLGVVGCLELGLLQVGITKVSGAVRFVFQGLVLIHLVHHVLIWQWVWLLAVLLLGEFVVSTGHTKPYSDSRALWRLL